MSAVHRLLALLGIKDIEPDPPFFACEKCGVVRVTLPPDGLCRIVQQGDLGNRDCCFGVVVQVTE